MTFWVYEDDVTNSVRVHKASCLDCNYGKGKKGFRLPDNRWHGAFGTKREAIAKALSTGRREAKGCGNCLPNLGSLQKTPLSVTFWRRR